MYPKVQVYYYKNGVLHKVSNLSFKNIGDTIDYIKRVKEKGRFKNQQLVYVEYTQPYDSRIILIED